MRTGAPSYTFLLASIRYEDTLYILYLTVIIPRKLSVENIILQPQSMVHVRIISKY